jgi:hypothetical protein
MQEAIKQRRHRLGGWSGRYYLSMCHGARPAVIDRTILYVNFVLIQ